MSEEPKTSMASVHSLGDARKKAEDEYIESVKKMIEDEPELLRDVIIISPALDNIILPPHYSEQEAVGAIEMAKMNILFGENPGEGDEDETE